MSTGTNPPKAPVLDLEAIKPVTMQIPNVTNAPVLGGQLSNATAQSTPSANDLQGAQSSKNKSAPSSSNASDSGNNGYSQPSAVPSTADAKQLPQMSLLAKALAKLKGR